MIENIIISQINVSLMEDIINKYIKTKEFEKIIIYLFLYFILFYFILFVSLFYFILFVSLFYFILFYFIYLFD